MVKAGRLLCALPSGIFSANFAGAGSGHIGVRASFPNAKDFNLKGFIRMSTVSMLIVACGVLALLYGAYAIRSVLAAPALEHAKSLPLCKEGQTPILTGNTRQLPSLALPSGSS